MEENYITVRIWKSSLKNLRLIHALTGDSMVKILDRIIQTELERVQREDREENKSSSPND